MMPASKHGDPQLGVDIHLCVVPPSPSPVPLPTPHMSIVFDPFDYVPFIGATVTVCGMKRATAGHERHRRPHSAGLSVRAEAARTRTTSCSWAAPRWWPTAIRSRSSRCRCWAARSSGMPSIPRLKKKGSGRRSMLLPDDLQPGDSDHRVRRRAADDLADGDGVQGGVRGARQVRQVGAVQAHPPEAVRRTSSPAS